MRRNALLFTAVSVMILGVLAVSVIDDSAFASQPAPPGVFVMFTKLSNVGERCPSIYKATLISQAGFEGNVTLSTINLPNTMSVAFNPNPIFVPVGSSGITSMVVMGSYGTPIGNLTLSIKVSPSSVSVGGNGLDANGNPRLTVPVGPCIEYSNVKNNNNTGRTTTIISTSTVTKVSTVTSTNTTTVTTTPPTMPTTTITAKIGEETPDLSTSAWAISATVAAAVLALVVFLRKDK
jgi:hypothetical protein